MTVRIAVLVTTGGALGAMARFAIGRTLDAAGIPGTTLAVNVLGSFLLGLVLAAGFGTSALALLGVGVCGALTTFSSFAVETTALWDRGDPRRAVGYALGSLVLALGAVAAGGWVGSVLA